MVQDVCRLPYLHVLLLFKIKGLNYSITSACSTSAHCSCGDRFYSLRNARYCFCRRREELDRSLSSLFDAMGAMSSKYNDTPHLASRAYDAAEMGL